VTQEATQVASVRESLVTKLADAEATLPARQNAHAEAIAALDAGRQLPIEELLKLTAAVSTAAVGVSGNERDITKLKTAIAALDIQAKREKVVSAISPLVSAIAKGFAWDKFPCAMTLTGTIAAEALSEEDQLVLLEHDVKALAIKVVVNERLVDVKPAGLPAARAPRASTGNGGGRFSKRMYQTPSGALSQSDVFKAYAIEAGVSQERYDAVLADPSNQGISHRGKAVAIKLGFAEIPSE
jgi:hypothetical protein